MYSQKLEDFKKSVDSRKALMVESSGIGQNLRNVIEKYRIHIDQASEVYSIIMLVVYGAMSNSAGFEAIHKLGIVSEVDFINLVADINQVVLGPIENQIKQSVTNEHEMIQKNYEARLNSGAMYDEALNQAKQNLATKNDTEDEEESVEQILARIDREVEDEIRAEIEQEMAQEAQSKQQDVKQNEQSLNENVDGVDIDLDQIPKSKAPTYIHSNIKSADDSANEESTKTQNQTTATDETIASENYHKDPYREEL